MLVFFLIRLCLCVLFKTTTKTINLTENIIICLLFTFQKLNTWMVCCTASIHHKAYKTNTYKGLKDLLFIVKNFVLFSCTFCILIHLFYQSVSETQPFLFCGPPAIIENLYIYNKRRKFKYLGTNGIFLYILFQHKN